MQENKLEQLGVLVDTVGTLECEIKRLTTIATETKKEIKSQIRRHKGTIQGKVFCASLLARGAYTQPSYEIKATSWISIKRI
jgi:hypothetical protein